MIQRLKEIKLEYRGELDRIESAEQLESFRVKYLGRKGEILNLSKSFKDLSKEEKPEVGKLLNEVKNGVKKAYELKVKTIKSKGGSADGQMVDLTLPGKGHELGRLHPMTQMHRLVSGIFKELGFEYVDSPEITTVREVFDNLNYPQDHPVRDSMDTFELGLKDPETRVIARPQITQTVVQELKKQKPPFRIFFNGRMYRNENVDAKHGHTFYQMEAWIVDKKEASFANAKYIMKEILQRIFKRDVELRVRTGFFPFVEPGFEGDFKCLLCDGKGCKTCGYEGWIELFPGGPIHPNVLKAGGVDPNEWEGVAINFGWDRMCMLAHQIDDLRHILSGDLRFVRQF